MLFYDSWFKEQIFNDKEILASGEDIYPYAA